MVHRRDSTGGRGLSDRESDEIEIVEFCLGEKFYGINVMQVREIIRASMGIVPVSGAHPSICGVINLRGKIIPVINLSRHFGICADYDLGKSRIIVLDFRQDQGVGFWVHHVTRIHRISLSAVETPSDLVQSKGHYVVGITKLEGRILFLMDFRRIAADINPGGEAETDAGASSGIPTLRQEGHAPATFFATGGSAKPSGANAQAVPPLPGAS